MWISGFRIIWVKVDIRDKKHFYLNLPISLYAFEELLDWFMDLLELACFFTPKKASSGNAVSVHTVKEVARSIIRLMDTLKDSEPYDLVDVTTGKVKVSVRIG